MEKEFLREVYTNIRPLLHRNVSIRSRQDFNFRNVVLAALIKAFEFNELINEPETHSTVSFFYMATLRGICEDLITLTYIHRKFSEVERDQMIATLLEKSLSEHVAAQTEFFRLERPTQPIMGAPVDRLKKTIAESEAALKKLGEKAAWGKDRSFPSVSHMATEGKLIKLYQFLYHATSDLVHFSPHSLFRMGWAEKGHGPEVVFSTKNFQKYYEAFNQFYGTYLFVRFWKSFKAILPFDSTFKALIEKLQAAVDHADRWPEIVSFEEMNLKPPDFRRAHVQNKLLADMSIEERNAFIHDILKAKGAKRVSGMTVKQKRDLLTELSAGTEITNLSRLTDEQLTKILQEVGNDMLRGLRKDISVDQANKVLLQIPTEELLELIELIGGEVH